MENLKEIVRKNRIENNYKQAYICHLTGMTQSNYSQIESGRVNPTLDDLEKIAGVYGKTVSQFLEDGAVVKIVHNQDNKDDSINGFEIKVDVKKRSGEPNENINELVASQRETIAAKHKTIAAQETTIAAQKSQIEALATEVLRLRGL